VAAVALSGEQALASLAAAQPDLVLVDIRLNGKMDGIDIARLVRERAKKLDSEVTRVGRRGRGTTVDLRIPLARSATANNTSLCVY